MDKFKTFFLRVNFMNEAEYEELSKYATFSIKLPTSNLNVLTNTTLQIKLNAILPINLFKSFYQNIQKSLDKLNVVFVGSPLPADEEQFTDYIQFYFNDHNIHNVLVRNLIERQAFSISDSGLVIITYDNKSELHEFKLIEEDLLSFFKRINFFVTGFDYEFNKNRQELEASRKAREEQLQASRVSFDSEKTQLLKVKKYNSASIAKFKCPSVKLNQIVYGGDDNYVIVTGEIFKVKIDSLKSGTQKYTFYITDYEDTFVITAFAGVKKAFASWGMDTNLPVPYLNSLRVGD
jgi:DNA polymerase III alpha subunit (gram-positive type)